MRSLDELGLIAAIADDLAAGIWVATVPEGRFAYANRAFESIMGTGGLEDVAAGQYAEPYGIYDREGGLYREDRLPFARALAAKATVVVDDIVIHRRDGRRVFVRAHGKPMFDDQGVITHIAIVFFDITREAEAEQARAKAEDRLRRVVASAPIVLYTFDREGMITFVEGSGLAGVGEAADFLGKSVFDIFPDSPNIGESSRRALAGETVRFVAEIGHLVYEAHLAPLRNDGGEITGAIGVSTDVTDRRRVELQLAQSERLASIGMLAAGVAHEINNPLTYVMGNLDLVSEQVRDALQVAPDPRLELWQAMLSDAHIGADRVRVIVRGLKVFSRVKEEKTRPIDVRVALDAAIGLARNELRHRAQLTLDVAEVPLVMGDEGRAGQLFLNLLINATQAIAEGAAEKNVIAVTVARDHDFVRIEVRDTGTGIRREDIKRIFDPFFTTKPVGVGTGLGLPICHAIVTDFGGRIEVESEVGRGSVFRIHLPIATGTPQQLEAGASRSMVRGGKRGRVLAIDDEPLLLAIVDSLLSHDHEVTIDTSAANALQKIIEGARFDVILCDLMMPNMSGIELHQRLLEVAPDQAAVMLFVTGGAFTPQARAFLEEATRAAIDKPFDAETLCARVRELVG